MAAVVRESPRPQGHSAPLNEAQFRAATFGKLLDGRFTAPPLLIIAGAGTGKTNTLAHRVAHLLLNGVAPQALLLMTFSRRAAQEMIRRAQHIIAEAMSQRSAAAGALSEALSRILWAGTFHSVGARLLRQYAGQLGLNAQFTIIDRGDAADLMDVARQELDLSRAEKRFPRKDTCLAIYSHRINTQGALEHTLRDVFPWCTEWQLELTQLYRHFVEIKQQQHLLDYDDLLLYWHILMQEPELAREVGAPFSHVLVDEYQDTNTLQAEILHAMKPDGQGVCVVGDDAQAIYGFRAASVENILKFPRQFSPPAEVIALEENYRSVQPILDSANALMANGTRQYQKSLRSARASELRPRYVTVADERAQADYVVHQVLACRESGTLLRQQAVLMRSSHHSDVLELELVRRNIPYVKYGGLKFLEAAHVKDVLGVLRWAENPRHRLAAFRTLQLLPGVGPAHADRCFKVFEAGGFDWHVLANYQMPAAAREDWCVTVELIVDLAGANIWEGQMSKVRTWYAPHLHRLYEAATVRNGDLEQLERISHQFGTRERFLTELTLDPPKATGDQSGPPLLDEDYLVLSTIHSAKGQEWKAVHVLNVADGHFPSEFATGKPELIEEERRLLYVAMTRAKDELHLIAPLKYYVSSQHRAGDEHVYGAKSRFITPGVAKTLEPQAWPREQSGAASPYASKSKANVKVDAAARARDLWG